MDEVLEKIKTETEKAVYELFDVANLKKEQLFIVGCSSSEVGSFSIGSHSSAEIGEIIFSTINNICKKHGIYLACQCCEHLNRALVIEEDVADKFSYEIVSAVPWLKGGGSLATAAYNGFKNPVVVEHVKANAGIDIGDTLIGMHLKDVAVPVRIEQKSIGGAHVVCARTRPKLIGGERAHYK